MATRSGDKIGGRRTGRRRETNGSAGDEAGPGPVPPPAADVAPAGGGDPWAEWAAGRIAVPRRTWVEPGWADPGGANGAGGAHHLQPFTRTAEVPVVGGGPWAGHDPYFAPTGMVAALPRHVRPRTPLGLVLALWLVALALVAALAGLVVHQVRPQWLRSLEVHSGPAQPATATTQASGGGGGTTSGHDASGTGHRSAVRQSPSGPNSAAVSVAATSFQVVVSTQAPCWVQVTSPASFAPVFSSVMPAGTTQTFSSSNGQLTVQLGASKVLLQVRTAGKTVPGWQFAPSAVPFTLNFTSAGG